jgi:hypothetical protein
MKQFIALITIILTPAFALAQGRVEGKVMVAGTEGASGGDGLPGANIVWAGTSTGTSTNTAGYFTIRRHKDHDLLVASFIGYTSDTVRISPDTDYVEIFLEEDNLIDAVTVISRASGAHLDREATIATVSITAAELCKAPAATSRKFGDQPSVDVNYSDAATSEADTVLVWPVPTSILTENSLNVRLEQHTTQLCPPG